VNYSNRPIYQRRRLIALLIFVGLLILIGLFWVGLRSGGTDGEQTEQEVDGGSSVEQAPGTTIDEQTVAEEETVEGARKAENLADDIAAKLKKLQELRDQGEI
jgi:hypothetical protein